MPSPSPILTGFTGSCPRCGRGSLFAGMLTIVPHCAECRLSFDAGEDSGDGPVYFALLIVGFLSVALAAVTELRYHPPLWLHALIWIPFTLIGCIVCMRFFKAFLIAVQYKNNPDSFR
jgi:uncharacterized protein (DUF983 family)